MKNKVLSCIWYFIKEVPDSPISVQLIVNSGDCSEAEVKQIFQEFKEKGLLKKKSFFAHVYTLTDEGYEIVRRGWEDYTRFKPQDSESDSQESIAS